MSIKPIVTARLRVSCISSRYTFALVRAVLRINNFLWRRYLVVRYSYNRPSSLPLNLCTQLITFFIAFYPAVQFCGDIWSDFRRKKRTKKYASNLPCYNNLFAFEIPKPGWISKVGRVISYIPVEIHVDPRYTSRIVIREFPCAGIIVRRTEQ